MGLKEEHKAPHLCECERCAPKREGLDLSDVRWMIDSSSEIFCIQMRTLLKTINVRPPKKLKAFLQTKEEAESSEKCTLNVIRPLDKHERDFLRLKDYFCIAQSHLVQPLVDKFGGEATPINKLGAEGLNHIAAKEMVDALTELWWSNARRSFDEPYEHIFIVLIDDVPNFTYKVEAEKEKEKGIDFSDPNFLAKMMKEVQAGRVKAMAIPIPPGLDPFGGKPKKQSEDEFALEMEGLIKREKMN